MVDDQRRWKKGESWRNMGLALRELTIQDGDGIQTVSVAHTSELKSLKIETRQGVKIEVGSTGSRTVHTFNLPEGCAFLGFQGRSGERIDKLQVVYAELVENW